MEPVLDAPGIGTADGPLSDAEMPRRKSEGAGRRCSARQVWRLTTLSSLVGSAVLGIASSPGCPLVHSPRQQPALTGDACASGADGETVWLAEMRRRSVDNCWYAGARLDTFAQPFLAFWESCECCRQARHADDDCRAAVRGQIDVVLQWASDAFSSRDRVRSEAAFDAVERAAMMACSVCGVPAGGLLRLLAGNSEWHDCRESDDWLFLTFREAMDCVPAERDIGVSDRSALLATAEELSRQAEATCGRWIAACNDAHWFFQEPASREGVTAPVLVPREEVTEAYSRALRAWLDVLGIALGEDR